MNKKINTFSILLLLSMLVLMFPSCKQEPQLQAAYALIERVTPGYGDQYRCLLYTSPSPRD